MLVDGANNKWFGTDNGGVIYTNPNVVKEQLLLLVQKIRHYHLIGSAKIAVDKASGKVFFATDKGIVAL